MLLLLMTYHQVLPVYLDFLFPFGFQQYPRDPYFSDFRAQDRFPEAVRGLNIPGLARSGRDIRMCYTLKSAERTNKSSPATWSIRQTSVYHSFDIETGRSTWVVVKGDNLIKQRLQQATNSIENNENVRGGSVAKLFASTFIAHEVLCDWAGQNWRWYLNDLEERVQMETRQAASVLVNHTDIEQPKGRFLRAETGIRDNSPQRPAPMSIPQMPLSPPPTYPPGSPPLPGPRPDQKPKDRIGFGLEQVQMVQYVQDKAGEALLVIESNANVISEIREYYQSVMNAEGWPDELKSKCGGDTARFDKSAGTAEKNLRQQYRRAETLRSFLEDRKAIVRTSLDL